jgi:hypothetical protein
MADYLSIPRRVIRGAPQVRVTSPVLARYLDDLAKADRALAGWDNYEALSSAGRLGGAAEAVPPPRSLMEPADYSAAIESMLPQRGAELPLVDQLLRMDRTRTLLDSRLGRLTPEQQASSLPLVGRRYEADQATARAAQIKRDADAQTAGALTAAAGVGAAAFAARVAQEREAKRAARDANAAIGVDSAVRDIDINTDADVYVPDGYVGSSAEDVPDLFADDTYLPVTAGVDELALMDQMDEDVAAVRPPYPDRRARLRDYSASDPMMRTGVGQVKLPVSAEDMAARSAPLSVAGMERAGNQAYRNLRKSQGLSADSLFADDTWTYLEPDSPDQAIANAPGPDIQVGRNMDMEDLPGPQMRSVQALMRAGIPAGRAMDIITKGASMSPDEYRMVTGGRR